MAELRRTVRLGGEGRDGQSDRLCVFSAEVRVWGLGRSVAPSSAGA